MNTGVAYLYEHERISVVQRLRDHGSSRNYLKGNERDSNKQ